MDTIACTMGDERKSKKILFGQIEKEKKKREIPRLS